jgi:hypothetical protein
MLLTKYLWKRCYLHTTALVLPTAIIIISNIFVGRSASVITTTHYDLLASQTS